ncbi:MAG: hypothetical protein L3J46_01410 [Kangiellaceae bacterium]|nr:hypothetical protein [Kangiellaceae bacterium]
MSGFQWWFKTQAQHDEFELALSQLRTDLAAAEVNLLSVERVFADYIVPEEDLGHVYWYSDAHKKLEAFESNLTKNKVVDIKLLQQAMNELKHIGQSNDFHQHYQLEDIQNRVNVMYQELQAKIVEQQSIERAKLENDKEKQIVALAEAEADKAAAVTKSKMMDNIKIKEKRLAIIEQKKMQLAEKDTAEIRRKEQNELAEIQAKQAETERQTALQQSYANLEIKEKAKELPLEELIEVVNQKIEDKKILTFIQQDQLSKLGHTIEEKKAM